MNEIAYSSRLNFEKAMNGHRAVNFIEHLDGDVYLIERTEERPPLTVRIADIYIMGECDIYEITAENKDIDAIILVGYYNRYSNNAKETAKDDGIALFTLSEFYGALHRSGESFINYVPRPKKDN